MNLAFHLTLDLGVLGSEILFTIQLEKNFIFSPEVSGFFKRGEKKIKIQRFEKLHNNVGPKCVWAAQRCVCMGSITRHMLFWENGQAGGKKKKVRLEYFCTACKKDQLPIDKPSSG